MDLTIGDLAKKCGMAASAIRFYESRGLVHAKRSLGGQRRYDPSCLTSLKVISFAQSAGFTLSEIATLHGPLHSGEPLFGQWRELAEKKLAQLDEVIIRAQEMKRRLELGLRCGCTMDDPCPLLGPT